MLSRNESIIEVFLEIYPGFWKMFFILNVVNLPVHIQIQREHLLCGLF